MKNKLIYTLFISLLFMQDDIGSGLHSSDLINFLQNNYKTNSTLTYNDARDILYSTIDIDNNNRVYCIYTNYFVTLPTNVDPSTYLYENGMNCEHLWPQSMYEGSSPMKSDMHHLRPCKENANSYRSNKPFNESSDNSTNNWLWLSYNYSNTPSDNINEYSENGSSIFEPREDVKGDIARALFYFYTIYTNEADDNFFNLQKEILYQWHNNDPVNNNEINRTWAIAEYQNNIPNPFIIDNTLIYRCYFYDESELGCDGIPNSGLELDECGVCGGGGPEENFDCDGNCIINIDCNGQCGGVAEFDCFLNCGGIAELDDCGICEGDNFSCIDNCGVPNGDNITCADLNNDNTINVSDVIFLVNLVLSGSTNSSGDINNDGLVNISDIVMLIYIIIGESL
jgi:hypothetical protein